MNASKISSFLLILIAACAALYFAKSILIPFVVAVIIWFLIREVNQQIARITLGGKTIPRALRGTVSFLSIFAGLGLVVSLLARNIAGVQEVLPTYESNLLKLKVLIEESFGIDLISKVRELSGDLDFAGIISEVINSLTSLFGNAFLVVIYVIFLMLEERWFPAKLNAIRNQSKHPKKNREILRKIDDSLSSYITLKTVVSLVTGSASFIVLMLMDVDFAFFWAFLIFLLNYIPTIGSLIGTLFPAVVAALQFGELMPAVWVLLLVGLIQVIVGNILEPKLMGNSLNISSIVMLLALAAWGTLWGIVGMILAVPITVMMILIFAQFPSTRSIAVLLSEKGELN